MGQMAALKLVRILTHTYPNCELLALDVSTGKRVKLSEGVEWNDDGEDIEDDVSDEESEIPDISSDGDAQSHLEVNAHCYLSA